MSLNDSLLGTVIDGRYRLREFIGSGSYGSVFAADELTLGRVISQVAVKIITPDNDDDRKKVLVEILGLAQLTHDFIITYRSSGAVREGPMAGSLFLATELGDTTLQQLVKSSERLSEEEFRELVRGIAQALKHIHAAKAVHGDVKPANIIRVKGRWKLGDLGLMKTTRRPILRSTHGSLTFMAPEMLRHEFSPATDVYALGVTILWYFTGKFAHLGDSREEFTENLKSFPATVPDYIREPWRALVAKCLHRDPASRPTAEQVEAVVAPGSSHFAKSDAERNTIVVATGGAGNYATIREAIDAAAPGARIVVHPGKYREPLRIDKQLEIIGDGPPEEIVVSTRDVHCLEVATTRPVSIRGLSFRVRPGPDNVECYAIDIGQGKPVFKDCVIRSETLACVAVHDGADPTLRRCTIVGSRDAGVFVYDRGRGTFEGCDIFSNGSAGVTVSDGGDVLLRKCKVYDNQGGGAAVFPGGAATFEDCRLLTNGKAGATIAGRAVLRGCRVTDNDGEGLVLKEGARAAVTACDLRGNARGPWKLPMMCELERSENRE